MSVTVKMIPELLDHPYARFLTRVEKPTRYTGTEHGSHCKDWNSVEARICLAFPDIYDIGMSHLGFRILYRILNDDPRTLAERVYAPWVDMQEELRAHGQMLLSLENAQPLCDFDVVGFSLQYELTYTNILAMLDLGGVPLRSARRSDADPLVIAGGPVATHVEPLAPFLDAVLIGDGEEAATEIALGWARDRRAGISRQERLERLARIPGVYVPSLYATAIDPETGLEVVTGPKGPSAPFPIRRRVLADISKFPFPDDGPVGGPEAIFDRMSIEIARGCTEGCRFCQAGMIYRPVRERDPAEVVATVERALEKTGQDEVSLTALSTADVSCISPLIKTLAEKTAPKRVSLGVASLRAYGLAEDLLDDIRAVRATGLTFAPEAGTQRMRDVINKNVTEAQLLETAERVFSRGFDSMKLYFIIGLPTEEEEDVLGIVDVGKNTLAVGRRVCKGRPQVTVSVSTHVPKPHTPFQWCAMDPPETILHKQMLLRNAARGVRGLTVKTHDSTSSVLEGIFARGDRRLADVLERAYLGGARFDSWDDQLRMDAWQEAFEHFAVDTSKYLGTIPTSARLPWDHLDVGLENGFLAREYRRALRHRHSPPCGKAVGMFVHHTNVEEAEKDGRKLVCYHCGVACDLTQMRRERIGFLSKMGADVPAKGTRLPIVSDTGVKRPKPEAFRPPQLGTPHRVRVRFEKTGASALLGHLDLIRELPRVIRRAGIATAYTEGYHPKADMTFGPALSLGVASLDEYVDVRLLDPPPMNELVERLDGAAAGGLRVTGAALLGPHDPKLSALIDGARYVVALSTEALAGIGGLEGLRSRIAAFHAAESVRVRRVINGLGRDIEVKRFVAALRVGTEDETALLRRAGLVGHMTPLDVRVVISPSGAVKIAEVVEAITSDPDFPFKAVRAALTAHGRSPLELEAHRKQGVAPAVAG